MSLIQLVSVELQRVERNSGTQELAMQFSHCNNGTLALTYFTNLARPYDLELFFMKVGHRGAQF